MTANREALQALDARFKHLTESIVIPLKGKQDSQVPAELIDSLERLTEYVNYLFSSMFILRSDKALC
jgi:hypothetical protein